MTEASRKRTLKDFQKADGNQKPVDLAKKRTQETKVSVKDAKDKVGKKPKVQAEEESEIIDITLKQAEIAQDIPTEMFYVGEVYSLFQVCVSTPNKLKTVIDDMLLKKAGGHNI